MNNGIHPHACLRHIFFIHHTCALSLIKLILSHNGHCSRQFSSGKRHRCVVTESYRASEANLKKCHLFLEQRPRKTLCLSLSPATGIDSHFYWEMEKFVMIALKIPVVSSYFMSLCKSSTVFFKRQPEVKERKVKGIFLSCLVFFYMYFNFVFRFVFLGSGYISFVKKYF